MLSLLLIRPLNAIALGEDVAKGLGASTGPARVGSAVAVILLAGGPPLRRLDRSDSWAWLRRTSCAVSSGRICDFFCRACSLSPRHFCSWPTFSVALPQRREICRRGGSPWRCSVAPCLLRSCARGGWRRCERDCSTAGSTAVPRLGGSNRVVLVADSSASAVRNRDNQCGIGGALVCHADVWNLDLSLGEVWRALHGEGAPAAVRSVQNRRLPRLITAIGVGGSLGVAGAVFQTLSRNVLGSPDIIGFTTGAATAAVVQIVFFGGGVLQTAGALFSAAC